MTIGPLGTKAEAPLRQAHGAIHRAQRDIAEGHECAVDLDLDRFFDRVRHDALMARVARRVTDKRVIKPIRSYLGAGVMGRRGEQQTGRGPLQGSPLSPLLSDVYLDDLDRAYEWANSRPGYRRIARSWVLTRSLTNAYRREQGLQGFTDPYRRFRDATRMALRRSRAP